MPKGKVVMEITIIKVRKRVLYFRALLHFSTFILLKTRVVRIIVFSQTSLRLITELGFFIP